MEDLANAWGGDSNPRPHINDKAYLQTIYVRALPLSYPGTYAQLICYCCIMHTPSTVQSILPINSPESFSGAFITFCSSFPSTIPARVNLIHLSVV
jgi:hypothetical protein